MEEVLAAKISIVTHVSYYYPGLIVSDESTKHVLDRDPEREAREADERAYAFYYFDIVSAVVSVEDIRVQTRSERRNISCTYYINGEVLDIDQVAELPGDNRILLDNMRGNEWTRVIRCRTGNFQPFEDSDILVTS